MSHCMFFSGDRFETVVYVKIVWMVCRVAMLYHPSLSSAVHFRAKLAQSRLETAPKRCTVIQYSSNSWSVSPPGHHKNLRRSTSSAGILTWWNIPSISLITATGSCWNLRGTPSKVFIRSGPCSSSEFRDVLIWWCAVENHPDCLFPFVVSAKMSDIPQSFRVSCSSGTLWVPLPRHYSWSLFIHFVCSTIFLLFGRQMISWRNDSRIS